MCDLVCGFVLVCMVQRMYPIRIYIYMVISVQ